jgi:hypothetical protein
VQNKKGKNTATLECHRFLQLSDVASEMQATEWQCNNSLSAKGHVGVLLSAVLEAVSFFPGTLSQVRFVKEAL